MRMDIFGKTDTTFNAFTSGSNQPKKSPINLKYYKITTPLNNLI